jgi:hypothetical protein
MTRRKPRTLQIGDSVYLWRVHHRHQSAMDDGERRCTEVFSAFAQEWPRSPLRILFPETERRGRGYPGEAGVVMDYREPVWVLNLNQPSAARFLIEIATKEGWSPGAREEFVIADGYDLLRAHRTELARVQSSREKR